jgi:hypothetical protein
MPRRSHVTPASTGANARSDSSCQSLIAVSSMLTTSAYGQCSRRRRAHCATHRASARLLASRSMVILYTHTVARRDDSAEPSLLPLRLDPVRARHRHAQERHALRDRIRLVLGLGRAMFHRPEPRQSSIEPMPPERRENLEKGGWLVRRDGHHVCSQPRRCCRYGLPPPQTPRSHLYCTVSPGGVQASRKARPKAVNMKSLVSSVVTEAGDSPCRPCDVGKNFASV